MSLFTAQLYPGQALGFLALGASLHDILTRLKAEPQRFPQLDLAYSLTDPVTEPVTLTLPKNGLRMRFDGPEQRLRLIEIVDFTKNHIFFKPSNDKERDLVKLGSGVTRASSSLVDQQQQLSQGQQPAAGGPTFRHIYQRFLGPTYDGEFIPSNSGDDGTYVLSYPGVAFTFPMAASVYSPDKDVVSLLSSSSSQTATSMAIFSSDSWAQARETLWTEVLPSIKTFMPLAKGKDVSPDEISLVRIHEGGKLQLFRRWTNLCFWVLLGESTPQDLVAELGPPDAIYRKKDQRMYIHKIRTASHSRTRPSDSSSKRPDELTDTDQSSAHTTSDDYDSNEETIEEDDKDEDLDGSALSAECFYNYFYLGFDFLVSTPSFVSRSAPAPSSSRRDTTPEAGDSRASRAWKMEGADRLVVTKMILHANVPGSYPFNRHRRCRWEIAYLQGGRHNETSSTSKDASSLSSSGSAAALRNPDKTINSETPFGQTEQALATHLHGTQNAQESKVWQKQRGMVLNRGWGNSPGSSLEFLPPGGWEDGLDALSLTSSGPGNNGATAGAAGVKKKFDGSEDSTTTLYGFPGLVFEVLKNGFVSALTVY